MLSTCALKDKRSASPLIICRLGPWTEELAQKLMAQNELLWGETGLDEAERGQRRQDFADRYRDRIAAQDLYCPYVAYLCLSLSRTI